MIMFDNNDYTKYYQRVIYWTASVGNKCKSSGKVVGEDSVAEWSKALALGASPQGRGFKPHRYHTF